MKAKRFTAMAVIMALVCLGGGIVPATAGSSDAFEALFTTGKTARSGYVTDYYPLTRYTNLRIKLQQIAERSHGLVQIEVIGLTNEKREILMAKVGDCTKPPVLIVTQQHGDEPLTTEAGLKLLEELSWGDANAKKILDKIYLLMVVRANPDGSEKNWRYNVDPTVPAADTANGYYTSKGRGYDMNRYHYVTGWEKSPTYAHAPETYPTNPVPESVAVINTFLKYKPIWVADFHHQGSYVTTQGKDVTSSVLWPHNPDTPEAAVVLSKQLCMAMPTYMGEWGWGYDYMTQYSSGISAYAGIGRNGYGIAGAGSILVEIKSYTGRENKQIYIDHAYYQMKALLMATAEERLSTFDISNMDAVLPPADVTPENGIDENRIYYQPTAPDKPDTITIGDDMAIHAKIERNGVYYDATFEHRDGLFWYGYSTVVADKPESLVSMDDYYSVEFPTASYKGMECEFALRYSHGELWELDPETFKLKPGNYDHDYTGY